eukprot:m.184382 g.184382  ORF g.184382 m.184382 type:complete len:700 (+) comp16906_c0_seq2:134-2233(+)
MADQDEFGLPPKQSTSALYRKSARRAAATAGSKMPTPAAPLQRQKQADFIRSSNGVAKTAPAPTDSSATNNDNDDDDDDFDGLDDAIYNHMASLEESLVNPTAAVVNHQNPAKDVAQKQQPESTSQAKPASSELIELRGKVSILQAQLQQKERERDEALQQVKTSFEQRFKHEQSARKAAEKAAQEASVKLGFAEADKATNSDLERKYKKAKQELAALQQASTTTPNPVTPSPGRRQRAAKRTAASSRKSISNKPEWSAFDRPASKGSSTPAAKRVKSTAVPVTQSPGSARRAASAPAHTPAPSKQPHPMLHTLIPKDVEANNTLKRVGDMFSQAQHDLATTLTSCKTEPAYLSASTELYQLFGLTLSSFLDVSIFLDQASKLLLEADDSNWGLRCLLLHLLRVAVDNSLGCKLAVLGWNLESRHVTELSLDASNRRYRLKQSTSRFKPLQAVLDRALAHDHLATALSALQLETALLARVVEEDLQGPVQQRLERVLPTLLKPLHRLLLKGHWEPLALLQQVCYHPNGRAALSPISPTAAACVDTLVQIAFDTNDERSLAALGVLNVYAFQSGGFCHGLGSTACAQMLTLGLTGLEQALSKLVQSTAVSNLLDSLSNSRTISIITLLQDLPYDSATMVKELKPLDRLVTLPSKLIALKQAIDVLDDAVQGSNNLTLNESVSGLVDIHDAVLQTLQMGSS